jgi:hypothetical protein
MKMNMNREPGMIFFGINTIGNLKQPKQFIVFPHLCILMWHPYSSFQVSELPANQLLNQ